MALVLWRKDSPPKTMTRLVSGLEAEAVDQTAAYLVDAHDLGNHLPSPFGQRIVGDLVDFQTEKLSEYPIR